MNHSRESQLRPSPCTTSQGSGEYKKRMSTLLNESTASATNSPSSNHLVSWPKDQRKKSAAHSCFWLCLNSHLCFRNCQIKCVLSQTIPNLACITLLPLQSLVRLVAMSPNFIKEPIPCAYWSSLKLCKSRFRCLLWMWFMCFLLYLSLLR